MQTRTQTFWKTRGMGRPRPRGAGPAGGGGGGGEEGGALHPRAVLLLLLLLRQGARCAPASLALPQGSRGRAPSHCTANETVWNLIIASHASPFAHPHPPACLPFCAPSPTHSHTQTHKHTHIHTLARTPPLPPQGSRGGAQAPSRRGGGAQAPSQASADDDDDPGACVRVSGR